MPGEINSALGLALLDVEIALKIVVLRIVCELSEVTQLRGYDTARRPAGHAARESDFGAVEIDIYQGIEPRRFVKPGQAEVTNPAELAAGKVDRTEEPRPREPNRIKPLRTGNSGPFPEEGRFSVLGPNL